MITLTLCPVIEGVDGSISLKLKLHVTFSWLDLDGPDQRDPQAGTRWAQLFHKENMCLSLWHWASLTNSNCCEFQIRSVCPHVFSRLSFPKLYLQSQWVSEEERYSATFVLLTSLFCLHMDVVVSLSGSLSLAFLLWPLHCRQMCFLIKRSMSVAACRLQVKLMSLLI